MGARSPWLRLTGAAVLNLCLGTLFAWSVFLAPIEHDLAASRGEVSAVFSWSLVAFAAAVVVAGRLSGRLPSHVVALIAAGCTAAGMVLASLASTVVTLGVSYAGLVGSGNGLGYMTALRVGTEVSDQHRGSATGIVVGAYACGPLFAGPLAGALIGELGWRRVMAMLGVVLGVAMLGAVALIGRSSRAGSGGSSVSVVSSAPVRRRLALLWFVFFTGALPGLLAFGHAASIVATAGQAPRVGGLTVAAMAVGNVLGRASAGAASDRLGRRPSLVGTLTGIVVACTVLGVVPAGVVVVAALAILGTAYGSLSALVPAATADLVGPGRFGRVYGWVFTGWGVAGLVGPVVGATLYERSGDYLSAFRVNALVAAVGLCCAAVLAVWRR